METIKKYFDIASTWKYETFYSTPIRSAVFSGGLFVTHLMFGLFWTLTLITSGNFVFLLLCSFEAGMSYLSFKIMKERIAELETKFTSL